MNNPTRWKFQVGLKRSRLQRDEGIDGHLSTFFQELTDSQGNPASFFVHRLYESIFPDSTYGVNSGGEPVDIPKLKHSDLLQFHQTHYHPSNSRFITYGIFFLRHLFRSFLSILNCCRRSTHRSTSRVHREERFESFFTDRSQDRSE